MPISKKICQRLVMHSSLPRIATTASAQLQYVRLLSSGGSLSPEELQTQTLCNLGLHPNNDGVFHGKWSSASGPAAWSNKQINPATKKELGHVKFGGLTEYEECVKQMDAVKAHWASLPAPLRGEVVRTIGEELRKHKHDLGMMISLEMGKILTEGLGEVQEAIDICDYAVGLSRSLNGSVIPSERPEHFMMERYNPLKGHVGIISAFNFPVAVYFWNLALSLVCGNTSLWKPHESTSMVSVAVTKIVVQAFEKHNQPLAVASMICGKGSEIGAKMAEDKRIELLSFTGSTNTGRLVSSTVGQRFGKQILELGGNNALIVDKSADLEMAVRATLFGAVGTAGQRCTSQRRTLLHNDIYDVFVEKLINGYKSVAHRVGNPLNPDTLVGPLHNTDAVNIYQNTIKKATAQGGKILYGGEVLDNLGGFFVQPTVIEIDPNKHQSLGDESVMQHEAFAPILYLLRVKDVEEAIAVNNSGAHGLSSALFTKNLQHIFKWTGPHGSDCGIVNVNIGTSGAEIGGAFGGEKDTGGGRESGSDAWKQYMRRSTCTVNHSDALPLAQGVSFE